MKLAPRHISKHDIVEVCKELHQRFSDAYEFAPCVLGIQCLKWPKMRDDLGESRWLNRNSSWYGNPYVKIILFPRDCWPDYIPEDWTQCWAQKVDEYVFCSSNDGSKDALEWPCSPWDGAEWSFYEKTTVASALASRGLLKKSLQHPLQTRL